jgi:hypothetical protein
MMIRIRIANVAARDRAPHAMRAMNARPRDDEQCLEAPRQIHASPKPSGALWRAQLFLRFAALRAHHTRPSTRTAIQIR